MPLSVFSKFKNGISTVGLSPFGLACFVALGLVPVFITDSALIRIIISAMMFGAFAMAFDFTTGFINITNFGFSAFWGLGAYTTAILAKTIGLSPWIGLLAGFIVAGVAGFLVGVLTIRLGGIFASCMTWFVALALFAVATNAVDLTQGPQGITVRRIIDSPDNTGTFYIMFVLVVIVFITLMLITKSNIGTAFRAIGQDVEAAQASGINPTKYKVLNFTISCAFAGLIGAFSAHFIGIVHPARFQTINTIDIMVLAFVGGRGTIWGGLLCALLLNPIMDYTRGLLELRLILYGVLMIVVMIFYPSGLAGVVQFIRFNVLKLFKIKGKAKDKT